MIKLKRWQIGFTIAELLVVIGVIAILIGISTLSYTYIQKRTAETAVRSDLAGMLKLVEIDQMRTRQPLSDLPEEYTPSSGVTASFVTVTNPPSYGALTPVQNGVLFHQTCLNLIADPTNTTIHAASGGGTGSVITSCNDGISGNRLLITGWSSQNWMVPVQKSQLETYINSVPYDSWWIDRQDVVRGFYTKLISNFETSGGTWPINSFWDTWANEWSGVKKEELPAPTTPASTSWCIEAHHQRSADVYFHIASQSNEPTEGRCS